MHRLAGHIRGQDVGPGSGDIDGSQAIVGKLGESALLVDGCHGDDR